MTSIDAAAGGSGKVVAGIGGWLLLPLLGLGLGPLMGVWNLYQALPTLQQLGDLPVHQAGFIALETVLNFAIQVVASIWLLVLMLQKRASFPRLYQFWLALGLVWIGLDLLLAYLLFQEVFARGGGWDLLFNRETIRTIFQAVLGVAIWIPYMARSVRVKNTFVH